MGRQANVSLPDTKQRIAVFWGPESSLLLQLLNFDQKDFTESLKDRTYHSIWTLDPIFFLGKSGQNCKFGNKSADNIVTWQQVHSLTKKNSSCSSCQSRQTSLTPDWYVQVSGRWLLQKIKRLFAKVSLSSCSSWRYERSLFTGYSTTMFVLIFNLTNYVKFNHF